MGGAGGASGGGKGGAANLQNAGAASASLTSLRAREAFDKTTTQINALKTLQANARSLTAPAGTPNGLKVGWLETRDGFKADGTPITTSWTGAKITSANGANNINIQQSKQNAYLYWKNFSVGPQTKVNFDQSAGGSDASKWIAFNRVMGSVNPSHIYGSITAQGQVYILNQNGILFHNRSQVNTHALVASTLPINPYLAGDPLNGISGSGLLNNPGYQFLFSAVPLTQSSSSSKDNYNPGTIAADQIGSVIVDPGAILSSPTSSSHTGGRVMLVGSSVINKGGISTPDGQTILAAGLQVGVNGHPSTDPSLRGLDVFVGKVADATGKTTDAGGYQVGTVINDGMIEVPRGDMALAGRSITQNGAIDSSTSVSLNGRIDIQASFNAVVFSGALSSGTPPYSYDHTLVGGTTGKVEMGKGSVIRILPEWGSQATTVGTALSLPSLVTITGQSIHLASGATIYAPGAGGNATGNFSDMIQASRTVIRDSQLGAGINLLASGNITMDNEATISAAGSTDAQAPISENYLTLQLRGSELANSPLQRRGKVRGVDITIDTRLSGTYNGQQWIGTPLGDATGFVGLIERTVGELTAAGGTIGLNAGGSVALGQGSTLDVSGGWIQYAGGYSSTTKLIYQGHLVDISQATPDRIYTGVYTGGSSVTSTKWGVSKTYTSIIDPNQKSWQPGYLAGGAGGGVTIQAPSMQLSGSILGTVVNGPRQIRSSALLSSLAQPSSLSLTISGTVPLGKSTEFGHAVVFSRGGSFSGDGSASMIALNTDFFESGGIGSLSIDNNDGTILLPRGVELNMAPQGSVSLSAANIDVQGSLIVPGGSITATSHDFTLAQQTYFTETGTDPLSGNSAKGNITVGDGSLLSTAGLISFNQGNQAELTPIVSNGGSISLSGYRLNLVEGSLLDVSGGGLLGAGTSGAIYGNAGQISLVAGRDVDMKAIHDGSLLRGGTLEGYAGSGAKSGSLSITTRAIQIGGVASDSRILELSPDFFNQGGFSTFSLKGTGIEAGTGPVALEIPGIRVTSGTIIRPVVHNRILTMSGGESDIVLPNGGRPAVSLTLSSVGLSKSGQIVTHGETLIEAGSLIELGPRITLSSASSTLPSLSSGSLSISGNVTQIDGSLIVPGGAITLSGADAYPIDSSLVEHKPGFTLRLGSSAVVSVAGEVLTRVDPLGLGRRLGGVLPGGSVSLSGNIDLASGSLIDVSGATGSIFVAQTLSGDSSLITARGLFSQSQDFSSTSVVDSSGGSITLKGSEELLALGTLRGSAGGSTAAGGTLSVSSGRFILGASSPSDPNLQVYQSSGSLLTRFTSDSGHSRSDGYFAVDSALQGGFDNLVLGGNVAFNGPVSISLPGSIKVATSGTIAADSSVKLMASYVALGTPMAGSLIGGTSTQAFGGYYVAPSFGVGELSVQARVIDVGNLLLKNIGRATLDATLGGAGVIRGDGTLDIAGDLVLRAAQIYPVTATSFQMVAYDHGTSKGSITVDQSGGPLALPLSAGGTLSLYASSINQNGTLVAPFGKINLGWDGTGTSPIDPISGAGTSGGLTAPPQTASLLLGAKSVTSVSAIDPMTGEGITIPYGIIVNGTHWIDPLGVDITKSGMPARGVNFSASSVKTSPGSMIDLRGGGDLVAYHWISGLLGNKDITSATSGSYAIIPGYSSDLFPFSTFADTSKTGGDLGYTSSSLSVGDKISLAGGGGLKSGTYTLLPARYAVLPGAYLITPKGTPQENQPSSVTQADGSVVVAGAIYNGLNASRSRPVLSSLFEVDSPSVIAQKADYILASASSFLPTAESASPVHNGASLVIEATKAMNLLGGVMGGGSDGGRGANIDLASSANFLITGNRSAAPAANTILLNASVLSSWEAGSLLIGGTRSVTSSGISITPTTSQITVDDAGSTLSAPDLILASKDGIIVKDGSSLSSIGNASSSAITVKGDGALLRVSSDEGASVTRSGFDSAAVSGYSIGANATLSGASLTLDSSGNASIASSAVLDGQAINLNAGKIALNFNGSTEASALNLSGKALASLSTAKALSLTSYSSIDFHGNGVLGSASLASLTLHAGELLGDNTGADSILAASLLLDNAKGSLDPSGGAPSATGGSLAISGNLLTIGTGKLSLGGFQNVSASMSGGIEGRGKGTLKTAGNLTLNTPVLTGEGSANTTVMAAGALKVAATGSQAITPGLGVTLNLQGSSVSVAAPILLPSGSLSVKATTGDITLSSLVDVGGTFRNFFDVTKYTDAGAITLSSENGNINLKAGSSLNLSAQTTAGSAGSLLLSAANGTALLNGAISATAPSGTAGNLSLDVQGYNGGDLSTLEGELTAQGFTQSQDIRIRSGDVSVSGVKSHDYTLAADQGSITVSGAIDASGVTGGRISLFAGNDLTVASGAKLSVHGQKFDNAGKGGSINLEAGNGACAVIASTAPGTAYAPGVSVLELQSGATLDLGVDATAVLGQVSGTLHLRAPQTADATDVQVNLIASSMTGASSINVEGFYRQDANISGIAAIDSASASWNGGMSYVAGDRITYNGFIYSAKKSSKNVLPTSVASWTLVSADTSYKQLALNNATSFMSHHAAVESRITAGILSGTASILQINPGEEIVNSKGSLVLNNDWDLSLARYGDQLTILSDAGTPTASMIGRDAGFLTLRAAGDITFNGSLSDGFGDSVNVAANNAQNKWYGLYFAQLLPVLKSASGTLLSQSSWGYRIASGADFGAANALAVAADGSVKLGKPSSQQPKADFNQSIAAVINGNYQVIRTGTGAISVAAGGNIQLLNQFATIYTAGAQTADPTLGGTFDLHTANSRIGLTISSIYLDQLGLYPQPSVYASQYSLGGGNVSLIAKGNIEHLQLDSNGNLIADSSRQLPNNWLSRRGQTDVNGNWIKDLNTQEIATTSWWINFANFFEGVGALGGGNIFMNAGGDISNIDAVIPTQGRVTARDASGNLLSPSAGTLVETGGGDLTVKAGGNLDAGVYYVERGNAILQVKGSIITNKTRDAAGSYVSSILNHTSFTDPGSETYLPSSFFLGKGSISVAAGGDALLGPVGNVFMLTQSLDDGVYFKTYFSTYDPKSSFSVTSLGGSMRLRTELLGLPAYEAWMQSDQIPISDTPSLGRYQPWLRLAEQVPIDANLGTLPASVSLTSFAGDINLEGNLTLTPSATGELSLLSAGSITGLYKKQTGSWDTSVINISDASPSSIPGIHSPLAQAMINQNVNDDPFQTLSSYLSPVTLALNETSAYLGASAPTLQQKTALHDPGLLHLGDRQPVRIFATTGDLSGLQLYSPKVTDVFVGGDITDVSFSIQNVAPTDVSIVSAGGSVTLYDANTPSQLQAQQDLLSVTAVTAVAPIPRSGDIQVSGPGTLEVLAGGNIDLGTGNANGDGTGVGITSIGNARNPALPFAGADIVAVAGMSLPGGISSGSLRTTTLLDNLSSMADSGRYFGELAESLLNAGNDGLLDALNKNSVDSIGGIAHSKLSSEEKSRLALALFYIVLRDAGRDHNNSASPGFGRYTTGEEAIKTLFTSIGSGDILMQSRDIRTKSGGSIELLAPSGGVSLSPYAVSTSLTPPGIVTEDGGNIDLYTKKDVSIGIGRIFTLRGGDIVIWSDEGSIAAGSSSKTVQSAPPTRVLIDPQSGDVETDLAGLATGGGIGVLATVKDAPVGNVDLIAPSGVIDAGDAGIRSSGNLNLAATRILNADNIAVSGNTVGAPPHVLTPTAPNIRGATAASAASAANSTAAESAANNASSAESNEPLASIISVEVLGYGGGDEEEEEGVTGDHATTSAAPTTPPQAAL